MPRLLPLALIAVTAISLIAFTDLGRSALHEPRFRAGEPPAPRAAARILVYHDMEGLAGQNDPTTYRYDHPAAYAKGQAMLVADLNAVISGLFDGGATRVDVVDAHGSGNPEPDVITAKLDSRAKQVFRDRPFDEYFDLAAPNTYDAVVAVGMHAKTGSGGFASHTYTIGIEALINGQTITESEVIGYSWGRFGVPVIMVTGDDRLREDLRTMPWIEFVVTKRATAADKAVLRPVDQVHGEMRAQAKRAVENLSKAKPMTLSGPIRAAVRAVPPASLALLRGVPGVNYHDNMVEFTAADYAAAYDGIGALIGVATQAFSQFYREMIGDQYRQMSGDHPDSKKLDLEFHNRLFQRWYDVESGRWAPAPPPAPPAGKKYHGAN